jgi:hypothetical protein
MDYQFISIPSLNKPKLYPIKERGINMETAKTNKKQINKTNRIKKYSEELIKRFFDGRSKPDAGDCFYCQGLAGSIKKEVFQTIEMKDGKIEVKPGIPGINPEHIESHLKEKYYVGSLVIAALIPNKDKLNSRDMHNIQTALNDPELKYIWVEITYKKIVPIVEQWIKKELGME